MADTQSLSETNALVYACECFSIKTWADQTECMIEAVMIRDKIMVMFSKDV